jgi:hypothetical protein
MQGMGRIEDWMVAGEGLTVSVAQGKAKSGPPFIKTMKGWATPEIKIKSKSSRTLRVIHPPREAGMLG